MQRDIINLGDVCPKGKAKRVNTHKDMLYLVMNYTHVYITEDYVNYEMTNAAITMPICKKRIKDLLGVLI